MICAGFQKLLEPEYEVVGTVKDGLALLKVAAELKPDVVLVDIQPGTVWIDRHGEQRPIGRADILIVAPYNDQITRLRDRLPGHFLARDP
jgi:AmiR/NasT family two-component response regulator